MREITIGLLGAGRAAELHMNAYNHVSGVKIRFRAIFDLIREKADSTKEKYGFELSTNTLAEVFDDPEIDVIDICTPPFSHKKYILMALASNKHVICEKPLCGFFGSGTTDKSVMLEEVLTDINEIQNAITSSNKLFFYAENFIYAPAIQKAAEILKAKKSKILYAKGEESLAGSSSPVAGYWNKSGGGTLMRVGCHPLSAIIYLKRLNDPSVHVTKIVADIDTLTNSLTDNEHRYIKANPIDVEDHATVCLTFSDNTKAVVIACDSRLGGSKNAIELYCNDTMMECNLTMNNAMSVYLLDENNMDGLEISEMLQTKLGWNNPFISDDVMRGYVGEMQDFMECILENRQPKANYEIAAETVKVLYNAYLSSSAERQITFDS